MGKRAKLNTFDRLSHSFLLEWGSMNPCWSRFSRHLLHRERQVYSNRATIPSAKVNSSKHWARKKSSSRVTAISRLRSLTKSMKELAPRSNRSSLVNFGRVTGSRRRRVARISNIFNSVKLGSTCRYQIPPFCVPVCSTNLPAEVAREKF